MWAVAHAKLTAAGYVDIGLDHFARPNDELAIAQKNGTLHRNFQGYSTSAGSSLYGFGVSSISSTFDSYRQNFKGLDEWRQSIAAGQLPIERGLILTDEDHRRRTLRARSGHQCGGPAREQAGRHARPASAGRRRLSPGRPVVGRRTAQAARACRAP